MSIAGSHDIHVMPSVCILRTRRVKSIHSFTASMDCPHCTFCRCADNTTSTRRRAPSVKCILLWWEEQGRGWRDKQRHEKESETRKDRIRQDETRQGASCWEIFVKKIGCMWCAAKNLIFCYFYPILEDEWWSGGGVVWGVRLGEEKANSTYSWSSSVILSPR